MAIGCVDGGSQVRAKLCMERRKPRADTKPVVLSQVERERLRVMLSSGTISARVAERARASGHRTLIRHQHS